MIRLARRRRPTVIVVVITVAVATMITAGCWDRTELNEIALVLAMGLDATPEGKVAVTLSMPIPRLFPGGMDGGGGDPSRSVHVETVVAHDLSEAVRKYSTITRRHLRLIHLEAIVIGSELARQGLRRQLDFLTRFHEVRWTTLMAVTDGTAADALKIPPTIGTNQADYLAGLVRNAQAKGIGPATTLRDFVVAVGSPAIQPVLARVNVVPSRPGLGSAGGQTGAQAGGQTGGQAEGQTGAQAGGQAGGSQASGAGPKQHLSYEGTAVFVEDRMVGTLDQEETALLGLLMSYGGQRTASFTVPDPLAQGCCVSMAIARAGRRIQVVPRGVVPPLVRIEFRPEADVLEAESGVDYAKIGNLRILEQSIGALFAERIGALLQKLQKEYRADVIGIGQSAKSHFLTETQWRAFRWLDVFPDAEVSIKVKLAVRRVGLTWGTVQSKKGFR
jgi:spore germination protein KC